MKLENRDIITLAKKVAGARSASTSFSFDGKEYSIGAANEALRDQFNLLASDYNAYRRNKNDIFEIMQEVVDTVLPVRVLENYGQFAEIKMFAQGSKPSFVKKIGKKRAKQFITRVGLAGIYEVFKLDQSTYEIKTEAYGGAAQIGLEEFLDGTIDFNDLLDIIIEGLDESVYREIATALATASAGLQTANKGTAATDAVINDELDKLITVVRAYGVPTIYATLEAASLIVPATNWVSNEHKNEMNSQGYIGVYKGTKVVVLPQSFEDETNTTQVMDNSQVYIMASGASGKPVKIAMEGETIIDEYNNKDRSKEIQAYKKFGVGFVIDNDMAVLEITSLV